MPELAHRMFAESLAILRSLIDQDCDAALEDHVAGVAKIQRSLGQRFRWGWR